MEPSDPFSPAGAKAVDHAAGSAQYTLGSTRHALKQGLDEAAAKTSDVRDSVKAAASDAAVRLGAAADKGKEMLGDAKVRAIDTARQAQDAAAGYAKDEPVKALLMSAAAGAVLAGIAAMLGRKR